MEMGPRYEIGPDDGFGGCPVRRQADVAAMNGKDSKFAGTVEDGADACAGLDRDGVLAQRVAHLGDGIRADGV
ncbi:MAG: hypothetical protein SangKO_100040 [Sandaracinaceae bacterium]